MPWKIDLKPSCAIGLLLLIGCAADKGTESQSDPVNPPVAAYWSMEDTAGRAIQDMSGHGHNGSIVGTAALADGVAGRAYRVGGNGTGIDVPDDAAFGFKGSFTLSLSCKVAAFPSGQGFLLFRGDSRSGMDPFVLSIQSADSSLRFSITGGTGGVTGDSLVSVSAPIHGDRWYRVDAVFDTTGGNTVSLYVDGQLAEKKSTAIFPLAVLESGSKPGIGIGHHAGRTAGDYAFNGLIDEVRIFAGALPAQNIAAGKY